MRKLASSLSIMLCLISSFAATGAVYKWVDENGVIHYSDQPVDQKSKEIEIRSSISEEKAAKARAESQAKMAKYQQQLENEAKLKKEEQIKLAKDKQAKESLESGCDSAKNQLNLMKQQLRLVETDAQGELKYLSDEERAARVKEATQFIDKNCKGS